MYHRVGAVSNDWEAKYCVTPERFSAHIYALRDAGMRPCGIAEFVAWMQGQQTLPSGSFLLTFDDGFLGVYEHAAPVLASLGWPATVFLVTGLLGQQDVWCKNDNPSCKTYPLLGQAEIDAMRGQGFSFHSHSRTHADLSALPDDLLLEELGGSRTELDGLLGGPVPYVAYPYGRLNDRVLQIAQDVGYEAGFSVQPGFNRPGQSLMGIRRLDVFGTDTVANLLRKVKFGTNDGSWGKMVCYYGKRFFKRAG
jgi:peptidoglycan/xylan/chitin deacetylase (PgdA/CDA1 family)